MQSITIYYTIKLLQYKNYYILMQYRFEKSYNLPNLPHTDFGATKFSNVKS